MAEAECMQYCAFIAMIVWIWFNSCAKGPDHADDLLDEYVTLSYFAQHRVADEAITSCGYCCFRDVVTKNETSILHLSLETVQLGCILSDLYAIEFRSLH